MRLLNRVLVIAILLALICVAGFVLIGDRFESLFSEARCAAWFESQRPTAWLVAIGLLISDLILPVPATGILAALGVVYGVAAGAAIGAAGSMLAGLAGYGLARLAGRRGARWLATEPEQARFREFFNRWGAYAIILSRWTPVLPEVMTVLAGLAKMAFARFLIALCLGTIPMALLFAWVGHAASDRPLIGMTVAVGLPLLIWPLVAAGFGAAPTGRRGVDGNRPGTPDADERTSTGKG